MTDKKFIVAQINSLILILIGSIFTTLAYVLFLIPHRIVITDVYEVLGRGFHSRFSPVPQNIIGMH